MAGEAPCGKIVQPVGQVVHALGDGRGKRVRNCPDWSAIERAYRAGALSLRQLALEYRCAHSTIANKARRDGWTRERRFSADEGSATGCG